MKKLNFLIVVAALGAATALTGCSDEIVQPQTKSSGGELLSRGAYDYPAVEWDNVTDLQVVSNDYPTTPTLSLPWESGSGHSLGIPSHWIDQSPRNPDPKKRTYSRENGWNMVFHNLSDPTQSNKYFGLYNKYSGLLRVFFYSMAAPGGAGTTNTWAEIGVSGSTSMLNFANMYASAMNDRKQNPKVSDATACTFSGSTISPTGYQSRQWYGVEVEIAYDASATSSNLLSAGLSAKYLTNMTMSGSLTGNIKGNIQTIYSNSASSTNENGLVNIGDDAAKQILQTKAGNGGNFFNSLWNNLKSQVPQLIGKAASEGIDILISGGSSAITKGLSKLLGLSGRKTATPMSSTSKVNLGLTSTIQLSGTGETNVAGWGSITPFQLPQFASNNNLYTGKLGVWNLQDYPKVTVDLLMTSMYYPKELVPNPTRPRACYPTYSYRLSSATLVVNPELLTNYKVENMSQQIVFSRNLSIWIGEIETGSAYSLYGDREFYRPSSSNTVKVTGEIEDYFGGWNASNLESSYSRYWNNYATPVTGNSIMCHVYFELVSKTDSNERYAYSKYFPCTAVKGTFSHREETITQ